MTFSTQADARLFSFWLSHWMSPLASLSSSTSLQGQRFLPATFFLSPQKLLLLFPPFSCLIFLTLQTFFDLFSTAVSFIGETPFFLFPKPSFPFGFSSCSSFSSCFFFFFFLLVFLLLSLLFLCILCQFQRMLQLQLLVHDNCTDHMLLAALLILLTGKICLASCFSAAPISC